MKIEGLAMILLLAFAPFATAQSASAPQRAERLQERLQQIKERLKLTPDQVDQVRPVIAAEAEQLKALREKYGSGDQSRRTRMKMGRELRGIRNETDEKLKRILSKDQMNELKKMREEWRQERREGRS